MPRISDERREGRRRQILDAAVACFARKGFHRASMQDIIAASGLSPGAIYCHFKGKEEIIEAIADERHAQETALLAQALDAPDLRLALHQMSHTYFDWLKDPAEQRRRRVTVQVWAEALRDKRIAAIIRRGVAQRDPATELFRAAQAGGKIAADLDPDALSRLMLAILQGFILQQAWDPAVDVDAYVRVVDSLIDATFAGALAPKKGVRGGSKTEVASRRTPAARR